MVELRTRIYRRCKELGMTNKEVGEALGRSPSSIANYLNGHGEKLKETAAMRRRIFARHKTMCGCARCGYNAHPAALDYNHIDPSKKTMSIGQYISSNRDAEALLKELENCEVLCANCHRIHTFGKD